MVGCKACSQRQTAREFRGSAAPHSLLFAASASGGAEAAKVVGDGVLVTGGHGVGIGAADLTGPLAVLIAAQLELERVKAAQQPLVELLDHRRVAREAAKIQMLHLVD